MDRRMLVIIYRDHFEDRIQEICAKQGVDAFSEVPRVFGSGRAGRAEDSHLWPGVNRILLTVPPDGSCEAMVSALAAFVDEEVRRRGEPVGIKAFVIPCEEVV